MDAVVGHLILTHRKAVGQLSTCPNGSYATDFPGAVILVLAFLLMYSLTPVVQVLVVAQGCVFVHESFKI